MPYLNKINQIEQTHAEKEAFSLQLGLDAVHLTIIQTKLIEREIEQKEKRVMKKKRRKR